MSGTLETTTSTAVKQQHYLLDEVETRLSELEYDEAYELKKTRLGVVCLLTGIIGRNENINIFICK